MRSFDVYAWTGHAPPAYQTTYASLSHTHPSYHNDPSLTEQGKLASSEAELKEFETGLAKVRG